MKNNKNDWSINTLKEHFEVLLQETDLRHSQRFTSQEEAIKKADVSNDKRFDSVNEFRGTLRDQQSTLVPRTEYAIAFKNLNDKLDLLTTRLDKRDGEKTGGIDVRGWLFGGIMLLVEILTLAYIFFNNK